MLFWFNVIKCKINDQKLKKGTAFGVNNNVSGL